ncbi:DUF3221 domain-containing protein [Alkalihalophilus sp. As8PL]|uniref:DUF3221 domain-containing protein n=1 Tax=Alkalihalophilus sp. As8PL TaxID=3237103 RepID=A0AB39BUQ1_9BACI
MKALLRLLLLMMIVLLAACTNEIKKDPSQTNEPYITGKITDKADQSILVADEIYFSIDNETVIINELGQTIEHSDLSVGHTVVVWTNAPVMESYPAQGYAEKIEKQGAD